MNERTNLSSASMVRLIDDADASGTAATRLLKAYQAREPYEGNCVVVFATNGAAARRKGASELEISFEDVESCNRMPSFDSYAPARCHQWRCSRPAGGSSAAATSAAAA